MNIRQQQALEQNAQRDAMARRVLMACERAGVRSVEISNTNVFVVEDLAGTQYTVTVSRARRQRSR